MEAPRPAAPVMAWTWLRDVHCPVGGGLAYPVQGWCPEKLSLSVLHRRQTPPQAGAAQTWDMAALLEQSAGQPAPCKQHQ